MPLEGHWERLNTPLRSVPRREARAVKIVAALVVIGVVVVLVATLGGGSSSEAGPGCIRLTVASSTGGAPLHTCGKDAQRLCRSVAGRQDAFARRVTEHCRGAGL